MRDKIIDSVENRLREILTPKRPEIIYEAMAYSVFAGGKRLRPLLLLAAYEAVGGDSKGGSAALDFACAIEMIHCYSLIHDDLPAMDDDDFRRGKPTNHKVYGEAMAILAGDALLNTAVEVMADTACDERAIKAMRRIVQASGIGGMLGGQVVDMQYESREANAEALTYIHTHKTGALIRTASSAGAILGGADEGTLGELDRAVYKLGLAFQIKDDILDITSTAGELGKATGSDAKNKKLTYPSVYGMERSREDYERLSREAVSGISALFGDGLLLRLAEQITGRSM